MVISDGYREEFNKGLESSRIKSRKQAIARALLQGTVLAIAIFNGFPIIIKIVIFVVLNLILGGIMSSNWMQKKLHTTAESNHQDRLVTEQPLTEEMARKDPGGYEEAAMAKALRERQAKKNQQS